VHIHGKNFFSIPSSTFLGLLLLTDFVFILLGIAYLAGGGMFFDFYALDTDRGYAETFQYIKEFWILVLAGIYFLRTRSWMYLFWSAVAGYILFDDALMIHEKVGEFIKFYWHLLPQLGLRDQDIGELIVNAAGTVFFFLFFGLTYRYSRPAERNILFKLLGCLSVYAFFGVGMDLVHGPMDKTFLDPYFLVLEEGGEMVAISLMVWYMYSLPDSGQVRV